MEAIKITNNNQSYNKQYNNNHHNNYHNNNNYHQQPQQNFPGMVTPNMAPLPNYNQMVPQQQYMNQPPMPMMNMGYQQCLCNNQWANLQQWWIPETITTMIYCRKYKTLPPDVFKNVANAQKTNISNKQYQYICSSAKM